MISLLHPSRGRGKKAHVAFCNWVYKNSWDGHWPDGLFEHILSVDSDDRELAKYNEWARAEGKIVRTNKSVVEATNVAAKESKGDILIYLSDDFDCPKDWDRLVNKEFEGVTEPMLLKVDDCLQPFTTAVLTIPIMNRALYNLLGYFWHPDYKSMFVDEDLYWTVRKHATIKLAPHLKFPHLHHSIGKAQNDETYRRSEANWNHGKEVFARRKAAGFPL